jgi:hypothetical protein
MKKILQPTNDLFIQFSDDEVQELGLEQGQKYEVELQDDGSVKLTPWVKIELEIEEWSKEVLLMIIKESLDQDIPVNDVINNLLKEGLKRLEVKYDTLESESGLTNTKVDLPTAYNHYNVAEEDILKYNKVELSTASHDYVNIVNVDPNSTNNDTSITNDMLYNPDQE